MFTVQYVIFAHAGVKPKVCFSGETFQNHTQDVIVFIYNMNRIGEAERQRIGASLRLKVSRNTVRQRSSTYFLWYSLQRVFKNLEYHGYQPFQARGPIDKQTEGPWPTCTTFPMRQLLHRHITEMKQIF